MDIEVDYNPSPSNTFFISVGINEREAISFDYTTKGHRVIKQVLIKKGKAQTKNKKKGKPDAEWDAIVLRDGKFVKKYHIVWYDLDKEDVVNDEIWKTVWEKPISKQLSDQLLKYSLFISDHYRELRKYRKKMKDFEKCLSKEISKRVW
ncbi:MAG: hypothetical protein KJ574_00465 [Nanoarchaeota archaeon]|nr:hypothetical protein [Nanoarchaeota archaeon]